MNFIETIYFNSDIDDDGQYINCAQLKFPYYSDEYRGGRVYFKTDKELDKKMQNVREISAKDISQHGKGILKTYHMTENDYRTLFEIVGKELELN